VHERQDGVGHGLQLALDVAVVVERRRVAHLQRLRA
jgi:hypothetical protein